MFVWRLCRDCLPTSANLRKKCVDISSICGLCNEGPKNAWHSIVACSFAESCWRELGLLDLIRSIVNEAQSVSEWVFLLIDKLDVLGAAKFAVVAWNIWKQRNKGSMVGPTS